MFVILIRSAVSKNHNATLCCHWVISLRLPFLQHLVLVWNLTLSSQVRKTSNLVYMIVYGVQCARNITLPPLIFIFVAFFACLEYKCVILSRNDLRHGMHSCGNIGELDIHAYFNYLMISAALLFSPTCPLRLLFPVDDLQWDGHISWDNLPLLFHNIFTLSHLKKIY